MFETATRKIPGVACRKSIHTVMDQRFGKPHVEDASEGETFVACGLPDPLHACSIQRDVYNPPKRVYPESLNQGHGGWRGEWTLCNRWIAKQDVQFHENLLAEHKFGDARVFSQKLSRGRVIDGILVACRIEYVGVAGNHLVSPFLRATL
jgi:hypothetical protein